HPPAAPAQGKPRPPSAVGCSGFPHATSARSPDDKLHWPRAAGSLLESSETRTRPAVRVSHQKFWDNCLRAVAYHCAPTRPYWRSWHARNTGSAAPTAAAVLPDSLVLSPEETAPGNAGGP